MSDARPITFVTEFVCGSCWNSFSRDEGTIPAAQNVIKCPHCDHANPLDPDAEPDVTSKVAAAPAPIISEDSATFGTPPTPPARNAALRVSAPGAVAAPTAVSAPTRRLPTTRSTGPTRAAAPVAPPAPVDLPDALPTAAALDAHTDPGTGSSQRMPALRVEADSTPSDSTGDLAMSAPATAEVAYAETASLSSLQANELAEALAAAAQAKQGADATNDADDPPPSADVEGAAVRVDMSEAQTLDDEVAQLSEGQTLDDEDDLEGRPQLQAAQTMTIAEPDEWKLKAPSGLTYNFHSLDAMMGWAATKSGAEMQLSADGETWFDFAVFAENVRSGMSGGQAWASLGGGGAQREELRFVGMESGAMQVRSAMDDIAAVDAREAAEMRLNLSTPNYEGDGAVTLAGGNAELVTAADGLSIVGVTDPNSESEAAAEPVAAPAPARPTGPVPRTDGGRPLTGPTSRATGTKRRATGATKGPTSRPSKGGQKPAPSKDAGGGANTMVIVAVVIALAAIGVIAAHFGGFVKIPGLP